MYRVTHLLLDLGMADLDLGCSTVLLGQHRSCSTAKRPVEHLKSKSTQPRFERRWVTLYLIFIVLFERGRHLCVCKANLHLKAFLNDTAKTEK